MFVAGQSYIDEIFNRTLTGSYQVTYLLALAQAFPDVVFDISNYDMSFFDILKDAKTMSKEDKKSNISALELRKGLIKRLSLEDNIKFSSEFEEHVKVRLVFNKTPIYNLDSLNHTEEDGKIIIKIAENECLKTGLGTTRELVWIAVILDILKSRNSSKVLIDFTGMNIKYADVKSIYYIVYEYLSDYVELVMPDSIVLDRLYTLSNKEQGHNSKIYSNNEKRAEFSEIGEGNICYLYKYSGNSSKSKIVGQAYLARIDNIGAYEITLTEMSGCLFPVETYDVLCDIRNISEEERAARGKFNVKTVSYTYGSIGGKNTRFNEQYWLIPLIEEREEYELWYRDVDNRPQKRQVNIYEFVYEVLKSRGIYFNEVWYKKYYQQGLTAAERAQLVRAVVVVRANNFSEMLNYIKTALLNRTYVDITNRVYLLKNLSFPELLQNKDKIHDLFRLNLSGALSYFEGGPLFEGYFNLSDAQKNTISDYSAIIEDKVDPFLRLALIYMYSTPKVIVRDLKRAGYNDSIIKAIVLVLKYKDRPLDLKFLMKFKANYPNVFLKYIEFIGILYSRENPKKSIQLEQIIGKVWGEL